MIRKKRILIKCFILIIILIILVLIILINKHKIIITNNFKIKYLSSKEVAYVDESKLDNVLIDNYEIEIPIYYSSDNQYHAIIYLNNNIIDQQELKEKGQYNAKIKLESDRENYIVVELYKDGTKIYKWNKNIYTVQSIPHQFMEEKNKIGFCVHLFLNDYNIEKETDLLKALGINKIRNEIRWEKVSNIHLNNFYFTNFDDWMNTLERKKIDSLTIVNAPNAYFKEDRITTQDDISRYLIYLTNVSKHYPQIKNYEIFNEPNGIYKDETGMENYASVVKASKEQLKDKNVITGATLLGGSLEFLEGISKYGAYEDSDAFSIHLYNSGNNKIKYDRTINFIKLHNELLNRIGGFQKLYITETGASTFSGDGLTEEEQGRRILKQHLLHEKGNIEISYIYNFRDNTSNTNEMGGCFGVVKNDYSPKESYYIIKELTKNINGGEYIGNVNINGLETFIYDKDGKPKIIAWAIDSSKPVTINYDGFTATDLYGNAIENTNGKLEITDSPVYLDNVSTNYFYQAISNSITEGYSDFNSKFKDEIAKVNGLSNKINSLNQTATSLKNISTLDENTANNLMKSHFELGNDLINAYNNGSLNVEYVKLSSMLDSLNTIGNSYEDLITVSAKTRMKDLTDITNEVNNANSIIEKNEKLDIVYSEKIYKFSKDLLDTSSYVLGLEEENDIKTGLINSKALHAKYLANWSQEFSQLYINDAVKKPINKIIADNDAIINNTSNGISKNSDILNSYVALKNSLNNLITNETDNNLNKINNTYTNQMNLIKLIVSKYNAKELKINDNVYKSIIENFINLSDDYKELYELYKTDNDTISTKEVEETLNKVINRYNDNKDKTNDFTNETDIINKMTELFNELFDRSQNPAVEVQSVENYFKKQRILKTCDIASSMLENDIKQKADSEYNAITISSDKGINSYTNQDETITINLPKNAQVTSESSNGFKFTANGTKDVKLSIRGYDYTYTIKVNNIDKTMPKVTAQNGQSLKIDATDDNLKEIKIEKDGKETAVNNGQTITIPGIYKITATDKAGNSTNETAIVYGTYTNEQNTKVNYVTIKSKTKVSDVKQDGDYTIKDNNNTTAEVKRAPSRVNTNTEKDSNSYIATGDILQDNNNTYIVITLGDLSSNGNVGAADLIKLRKSLVGLTKLTKLQELAADTNQNGSVNVSDLLKERKIMVGME